MAPGFRQSGGRTACEQRRTRPGEAHDDYMTRVSSKVGDMDLADSAAGAVTTREAKGEHELRCIPGNGYQVFAKYFEKGNAKHELMRIACGQRSTSPFDVSQDDAHGTEAIAREAGLSEPRKGVPRG